MRFDGIPAHPLLVHAVVVLLPLAALAVTLHALWPAARRRLGIVTPVLAGVVVVLVPITVQAGKQLRDSLGVDSPMIRLHQQRASLVLPWTIALFVVAVAQWWWTGRGSRLLLSDGSPTTARRAVHVGLVVVTLVVALGATYVLVRAGDAGAKAVWGGVG